MTTTTLTQLSIAKINAGATGDTFLLADGTYDHPSREAITKSVIVKAQNKGKAIIKGAPIDVKAGTFQDFDLQYSTSEQTVVTLDGAGINFSGNMVHFGNPISTRQDWILVRQKDCIIENNEIFNKTSMGNPILVGTGTLVVTGTKIRGNYIHDQGGGTANGAEAIRLGSSATAKAAFNTEVSGNKLKNISTSDTELITVKSSNNDIHDNWFEDCNSAVCFRHGSFNKFRNNININSGFRMYGHNNEVSGNQFLRNKHSQIRQFVIGNGDYADDAPLGQSNERHSQVRDCIIRNNIVEAAANIAFCWGYTNYTYKPINNQVYDNIIIGSAGTLANTKDGASWTGNSLTNNVLWATGNALYGNMPGEHRDPKLIKNADGTYSLQVVPTPTPTPTPTPVSNIYDDFKYNYTFGESTTSPNSKWSSIYLGYGSAVTDGSGLTIQPKSDILRAALIKSTWSGGNYLAEWDVTNQQQFTGTPAQWYCPWAMIRYLDKWRHYYFYAGLTHCEFGKKDAPVGSSDSVTETYQKTLWTGGPATPLGTKRHIGFQAIGDVFTIWVDGTKVMEKTDVSSFKNGSYCIYIEGAKGYYQNVAITPK